MVHVNHRGLDVLTAAQLARELDLSASRVIRAIEKGVVFPDGKAGHTFIFPQIYGSVPVLARKLGSEIELSTIGAGKSL